VQLQEAESRSGGQLGFCAEDLEEAMRQVRDPGWSRGSGWKLPSILGMSRISLGGEAILARYR